MRVETNRKGIQLTPPQMEAHLSQKLRGQVSAGPSLVGPVSEPNAWAPLQGAHQGAPKSGVGCGTQDFHIWYNLTAYELPNMNLVSLTLE